MGARAGQLVLILRLFTFELLSDNVMVSVHVGRKPTEVERGACSRVFL